MLITAVAAAFGWSDGTPRAQGPGPNVHAPWASIHWKPTIHFVDLDELLDAVADGVLPISEIEGLPSLKIGDAVRADSTSGRQAEAPQA